VEAEEVKPEQEAVQEEQHQEEYSELSSEKLQEVACDSLEDQDCHEVPHVEEEEQVQ
jgi:predicted house-cleaning noncanonical NTP pyrophosphatase (MazG superfamily)